MNFLSIVSFLLILLGLVTMTFAPELNQTRGLPLILLGLTILVVSMMQGLLKDWDTPLEEIREQSFEKKDVKNISILYRK